MKKVIVLIGLILLFSGCQQVADVSALPEPYQRWAVAAFAQEGVDSCIHCDGPSIEVRLDPTLTDPFTGVIKRGLTDVAQGRVRIRFRVDQMTPCYPGGVEQRFHVVARHEASHTGGNPLHDPDPTHLLYSPAPCWPVD